jgi:hypothetical protein
VEKSNGVLRTSENPRYKKVIDFKIVRPAPEIPEIGLTNSVPLFNLVRQGKAGRLLEFVDDIEGKFDEVCDNAFVPFTN